MSNDKIKELKQLLTRLADSCKGYEDAADKAEQDRHQKLFTELSQERYKFALVIQDHLKRHGEDTDIEGSITGSVHRFFMDIANKLGDDEQLMEAIVTGESELLDNYRDAINDADYDPELLKALQQQYRSVETYLDTIDAKQKAA